ncbi:hypothetical protein [Polaribacter gangjinensis]|nr:hypothetical protein [Polaribacter gangjinensis]
MKKIVLIAISVLGIVCFSSCRSTSSSCGLANNVVINQTTIQQVNVS